MSTGWRGARVARRGELRPRGPKRLLASFGDERLVTLLRRGHDSAFEELFDRHCHGVLTYCSHILGSEDEGQDALQHTFLAAWQAVVERGAEPRAFNSWLYAIARNRCLSVLRSTREAALEWEKENVAAGERTAERVEQRAEVRELLHDLQKLPETQRTALVLAEFGDLSHVDIASVLGCPREKVKSLVFQARSSLARRSQARATPCHEVRVELASSPESRLPRVLRRHLVGCQGCGEFATEIRRQRRLVAIALPVAGGPGLKGGVLGALGVGGQAGGGKAGLLTGLAAKGGSIFGAGAGVGSGGIAGGGVTAGLATSTGLATVASAGLAVVTLVGAGVLVEESSRHPSRSVAGAASEHRRGAPEKRATPVRPAGANGDPAGGAPMLASPVPGEPGPGVSPSTSSPSKVLVPGGRPSGSPRAGGRSPGQGDRGASQRREPSSGVVVSGGALAGSPRAEGRSPGQGAGGGSQRREHDNPSREGGAPGLVPRHERQAGRAPADRRLPGLARGPASDKDERRECLVNHRADPLREPRCAPTPGAGRGEPAGSRPERPTEPRRLGPPRHERPGLP